MTEVEWLTCKDPLQLWEFLKEKTISRKQRLFHVACCRRIGPLLPAISLSALDVFERYADGHSTAAEYTEAWNQAFAEAERVDQDAPEAVNYATESLIYSRPPTHISVSSCIHLAAVAFATSASEGAFNYDVAHDRFLFEEGSVQSVLLRDIFGNPFRPVAFDPAWRSETVVGIAAGIYEDRAFERMPILADALQEAGCEHPDILSHCREPGTHVRGCWVVDLVLGKE